MYHGKRTKIDRAGVGSGHSERNRMTLELWVKYDPKKETNTVEGLGKFSNYSLLL